MTRLSPLFPPADHFPPADGASIEVVDSHTCGQPTRVVVDGAGIAPGTDPVKARDMLAHDSDWVRRITVMEPRGHRSMFGVVLIPPATADAPYGLVYMDANGYPDMCGHATIGAATTLFETGLLRPEPIDLTGEMTVPLRVPMGDLTLRVRFERGRTMSVAFRTPLAFYLGSIALQLPDGTSVPVDIAYGGQWYAYLPVERSGLTIDPGQIDGLIAAAAIVREALAEQLELVDPMTGGIPKVGNIVWTSAPDRPDADARNVPISSAGSFDRSPCGTATCARMAILAAKGELAADTTFVNQGLVGTIYNGRVLSETAHAGAVGIVPEVEGSAWLTAHSYFWVDPRDPLGNAFLT